MSSMHTQRCHLIPGQLVSIVLKHDQPTHHLTQGRILDILSPGATHSRGIKVRLHLPHTPDSLCVGRVQHIWEDKSTILRQAQTFTVGLTQQSLLYDVNQIEDELHELRLLGTMPSMFEYHWKRWTGQLLSHRHSPSLTHPCFLSASFYQGIMSDFILHEWRNRQWNRCSLLDLLSTPRKSKR